MYLKSASYQSSTILVHSFYIFNQIQPMHYTPKNPTHSTAYHLQVLQSHCKVVLLLHRQPKWKSNWRDINKECSRLRAFDYDSSAKGLDFNGKICFSNKFILVKFITTTTSCWTWSNGRRFDQEYINMLIYLWYMSILILKMTVKVTTISNANGFFK